MPSPGLERTARVIAENVASAVERGLDSSALHPLIREALMVELLRELLSVMPTSSGLDLADACNRCLHRIAGLHLPIPRVEAVDPGDGSVTMQEG
jgi:hypothetical protein